MKNLFLLLLVNFILIHSSAHAQWSPLDDIKQTYNIDGSIGVKEITDTSTMTTMHKADHYVIKRSDTHIYIGIRSNTSTILNTYLITTDTLKVLHASAALGEVNFIKNGKRYLPEKSAFDWIYRDPNAWPEKHPDGVNTIEEFYDRFGWCANTWYSGSYREFEMIIDRKLANNARLVISYSSLENDTWGIRFKEGTENVSITGDKTIDDKLHNGYLPESIDLK